VKTDLKFTVHRLANGNTPVEYRELLGGCSNFDCRRLSPRSTAGTRRRRIEHDLGGPSSATESATLVTLVQPGAVLNAAQVLPPVAAKVPRSNHRVRR
jgi:hypothetical protein